ncbi:MAG: hypothetical protein KKA79_01990, partial [Nanoarchaeota archaeon]|nr:hypothetical protein [Nanoarchaeota archaeon]
LVTDVAVGFTVKVKAFDYLGNWNECNGTYKGPFTVMVEIYVSMLMSAWNAWCAVGEAVKNALESLGSWILDTIISMVTSALAVIEACMESYAKGVAVAAASAWEEYQATGSISAGKLDAIVNAIFTPFVKAILVLVTVLIVVVRLAELATGVGAAITLIIPLIIGMVAISVDNPFTSLSNSGEAVESFFEWMFDLTNFDALDYITLIVATAALALSVASKIFAVGTAFALVLSVIGLILAWASGKNLMPNVDVILGCVGVAIAGVGLFFAFTGALGLGKDALASQGLVAALAILVGLISFIFGIVFLSITISKTTT